MMPSFVNLRIRIISELGLHVLELSSHLQLHGVSYKYMILKITIDELNKLDSRGNALCECEFCHNSFFLKKNEVLRSLSSKKGGRYCSRECSQKALIKPAITCNCEFCGKVFFRKRLVKKSKHHYCSQFCAAKSSLRSGRGPKKKRIEINNCDNCGTKINISNKRFCSLQCIADFRQKRLIEKWKSGEYKGWTGKTIQLTNSIRRYIFAKYDNKCHKCGWGETHPVTKRIPLEINHIDGNAENCREENLELLCPNCHSLTPNFRALNRDSKRIR